MANPAWFNFSTYMANKLAQLKSADADTYGDWDAQMLSDAFAEAGFSGQEGAFDHFNQYGNSSEENVSPNSNFIPSQYYIFKAAQYYEKDVADVTPQEAASIGTAIREAGMSAWQHYIDYGTAEKINPSNNFDTAKYLEAKAAALNAAAVDGKTDWDADSVAEAFKAAGMNALEHAILYSADDTEGEAAKAFNDDGSVIDAYAVDDKASGDNTGETYPLTQAIDNLKGTSGDDTFIGDGQTVQAADQIDGGEGTDTLELYETTDLPTLKNVENVWVTKANNVTLNVSSVAGVKNVELDGNTGTSTVTLGDGQSLTLRNNTATAMHTIAGNTPTELSVTLDKIGAKATPATVDFTGTALTTAKITAENSASVFTLANAGGKLATLNIAGDAELNIVADATLAKLTAVDASTNTGGVKLDMTAAPTDLTFTGSSKDDTLIFGAGEFNAKDVVDMGAGEYDTIVLAETAALTEAQYTALNAVKNAEVLGLNGAAMEVDAGKLTNGITSFEIGKNADSASVHNLASDGKVAINMSADHSDIVVDAKTGNNALDLSLDNGDKDNAHTITALDVSDIATLNIDSSGDAEGTTITALAENASKITVTSRKNSFGKNI